jgi:hypothetical protein
MLSSSGIKKITAGPVAFAAWSAVFAFVYTQLPLFASNQYQYFLHGLSQAGYGNLSQDWLARTADPTPLFSALVNSTYRIFHSEAPAYVYYGLLLGVYFYALFGIADLLYDLRSSRIRSLAFITGFMGIHSTAFRFLLSRIWNGEAGYMFEGGVAEQRILGQIFQPSSFGVFLLLSILFFLRGKKGFSILALAVAVYFHSTYLLVGALLTLGYLTAIVGQERSGRSALRFGLLALLAVAPVMLYDLALFRPTSLEIYNQAEYILAHFRIPEHAQLGWLFRWMGIFSLSLIAAALLVMRKTRLFPVAAVSLLGMLILTGVEWATGNDSLALLFPWRISSILVPLSSTILLAAGIRWASGRIPALPDTVGRAIPIAFLSGITVLLFAGIARFPLDQAAAASDPAIPMMNFVRDSARTGEVYFIPPRMESFRLITGQPVFVDLKSIPYRDTDVVEWYRRLMLANDFYQPGAFQCHRLMDLASAEGVHLFVVPTEDRPVSCVDFRILYQDAEYAILYVFPKPVQ